MHLSGVARLSWRASSEPSLEEELSGWSEASAALATAKSMGMSQGRRLCRFVGGSEIALASASLLSLLSSTYYRHCCIEATKTSEPS